ncbi:MAG: PP2C family protein-serine/threonine phosphatase [Planctomycetota bacterium]|jgi:hypothetical protein
MVESSEVNREARMRCMEVWGGNRAVDCGVVMSGLDAWLYSQPYREAAGGGDVHYVSSCATGRVTRLLVADVAGHGAEAADTGDALRRLMRRFVNHLDQTRFVVSLNHEFGRLADEGRFATSVVATFFAPTNTLTLSNAGHPPPLLCQGRSGTWTALTADSLVEGLANIPLGLLDDTRYDQFAVRLRIGDLVLFYTDSIIEAQTGEGRPLGVEGLLDVVRDLDPRDPEGFVPDLQERVGSMADGNLKADDVTLLLIRPNGMAPRVPLGRKITAPFRVMAGVVRSLVDRDTPSPWPELSVPNIGGAFLNTLNHRDRARHH